MMTNNDKGNVAELEIATAAVRFGVPVFKPLTEHTRSDLVPEIGGRLWRVQCKWGRLSADRAVVIVHTCTSRRAAVGYIRRPYTEEDFDLFAVYCGELDRSFLVPVSLAAARHAVQLRVVPARNNQQACINLADEFDFEGAVAQLGERRRGTPEVRGSSPLSSTSDSTGPITVGSNPFRDKLGYWMDRVASGEEVVITRNGKPRVRLTPAVPS
jgi:prevent-host-death family protein